MAVAMNPSLAPLLMVELLLVTTINHQSISSVSFSLDELYTVIFNVLHFN